MRKQTVILLALAGIVALVVAFTLRSISNHPGKQSYDEHCAKCHGEAGEGFMELYPTMQGLQTNDMACIIRNGQGIMLGNEKLSNIEITNIINYISTDFNDDLPFVHVKDVESRLKDCE